MSKIIEKDIVTERRRFLRFETALNALCESVSEQFRKSYQIKNISKEGALIIADKKFSEGDELNITMEVPGDNMPVFASCEVAWQKDLSKNGPYETGLKFTKIESSDKGRLLEYIYLQWLRMLDRA